MRSVNKQLINQIYKLLAKTLYYLNIKISSTQPEKIVNVYRCIKIEIINRIYIILISNVEVIKASTKYTYKINFD